jgi:hypothetical protein
MGKQAELLVLNSVGICCVTRASVGHWYYQRWRLSMRLMSRCVELWRLGLLYSLIIEDQSSGQGVGNSLQRGLQLLILLGDLSLFRVLVRFLTTTTNLVPHISVVAWNRPSLIFAVPNSTA